MSTAYGALELPADKGSSQQGEVARRRASATTAVAALSFLVACASVFYAGRMSTHTTTASYVHSDVFDLGGQCNEGQFIGSCQECQDCRDWEYAAGGCSYFKDTFCTLCEPIHKCPQENIRCSAVDDEICLMCDPGFYDQDCKPCTICDLNEGYFEAEKCTHTSDTVCQKCQSCGEDFWMSKQCEYFSDRECTECTVCSVGTYRSELCVLGDNDANELGSDTVCETCSLCEDGEWVSEVCSIVQDTTCTACAECPCEHRDTCEYRTEECQKGEIFNPGTDTVCQDCSRIKNNEWEVFACGDTSDALFKECSICQSGEYTHAECSAETDTVCPDCSSIPHCAANETTCASAEDSTCDDCDENYLGSTCCYQKTFGNCGTTTVRERIAYRYGFEGETNDEFINFCMELCGEFPDCLAFEVEDGGEDLLASGPNSLVSKEAACYFKAAYTNEPEKPEWDCYSNICRQGMHDTGLVYFSY